MRSFAQVFSKRIVKQDCSSGSKQDCLYQSGICHFLVLFFFFVFIVFADIVCGSTIFGEKNTFNPPAFMMEFSQLLGAYV